MSKLLLISILLSAFAFSDAKMSKTSALRQNMFYGYDKLVKPDDVVTVRFGLSILNLEICPHKQILTSHAWIRIFWKDSRLAWDPAEWNGVDQINLDASELWIPDVVPYNGEQVKPHAIGFKDDMSKVIVLATGDVIFVPPVIHRTFCAIDSANWPWGQQNCTLIFGSWTYSEKGINIMQFEDDAPIGGPIDTKHFANPRIEIISTSVQRNDVKYPCCPDNYPNLAFNIIFKQKAIFMKDTEMRHP